MKMKSSMKGVKFTLVVLIVTTAVSILNASPNDQVTKDRSKADAQIHWPNGFSPVTADLFAHNEIIISAPVRIVFQHIQEATKWPKWYSNSKNVQIHNNTDGLLHSGSTWDWDTFGVHIKSQINEFKLNSRIGWFGNGKGMRAYHTWLLIPIGKDKTKVIMEECVYGEGAQKLRRSNPAVMHQGHDVWNQSLKQLAENRGSI